jgi:hypothetical protein
MCKEQQELLDEGYKNYVAQTMFSSDPTWLKPIPCMDMSTGEKKFGARQYIKEEFINKIKTDPEFSEKWGLKIEERELSEIDRINWAIINRGVTPSAPPKELDRLQIPTKLITVNYKNEKIEVYE